MSPRNKWTTIFALCAALAFGVAACGDDEEDGGGGSEGSGGDVSGSIDIDGSSTVAPLTERVAQRFQEEFPETQVTVGTSGTGGGFEKFCAGETDINDASREIAEEEVQACEQEGIEFEQLTVANDGIVVAVNPDNPVDCLTVDQLNQIWDKGSNLSSWGDIDGLEEDFSEELALFGPGTDSGTFDFFTEAINGEEGKQRTDYNNVGEDDNQTVRGVSGNVGGMGYFGFSFLQENQDSLKALAIDDGDGCVEPSEESVQNGEYKPLGRELFIYPSGQALEQPVVEEFLNFYLDNAQDLATEAGYIALTDEQVEEARQKVENLTSGGGSGGSESNGG